MPPPAPPLPKMDGLHYWINHASSSNSTEDDDGDALLQGPGHEKIQHALQECGHLKDKLEAAQSAWRRAKSDADTLQKQDEATTSTADTDYNFTSNIQKQQAALLVRQQRQQISIHSWNYRLCLANSLCPLQCSVYGNCWKFSVRALGEDAMKQMKQNRTLDIVCQAERDMVQRCVGRHVANVVQAQSRKTVDSPILPSSIDWNIDEDQFY